MKIKNKLKKNQIEQNKSKKIKIIRMIYLKNSMRFLSFKSKNKRKLMNYNKKKKFNFLWIIKFKIKTKKYILNKLAKSRMICLMNLKQFKLTNKIKNNK